MRNIPLSPCGKGVQIFEHQICNVAGEGALRARHLRLCGFVDDVALGCQRAGAPQGR